MEGIQGAGAKQLTLPNGNITGWFTGYLVNVCMCKNMLSVGSMHGAIEQWMGCI